MVELLWRLVLKVNARAVFLFTLMLLCIVLVVLLHRGSRQGDGIGIAGHRVRAGAGRVPPRSVPRMVPIDTIEDPFTSAFLVAWLDLEESRRREREAARGKQAVEENVPPVAVQPPPPAAPPRPEPKWVRVTYQGMIGRTDGTRVALVREEESGKLHTLKAGDMLLGRRVKEITAERVLLELGPDGTEHPLRVGVVGRVPKDEP